MSVPDFDATDVVELPRLSEEALAAFEAKWRKALLSPCPRSEVRFVEKSPSRVLYHRDPV